MCCAFISDYQIAFVLYFIRTFSKLLFFYSLYIYLGPVGLLAPDVSVTSSNTVFVKWKEPQLTNGPITHYEILFPYPRFVVKDIQIYNFNATGLIPFTEYEVI